MIPPRHSESDSRRLADCHSHKNNPPSVNCQPELSSIDSPADPSCSGAEYPTSDCPKDPSLDRSEDAILDRSEDAILDRSEDAPIDRSEDAKLADLQKASASERRRSYLCGFIITDA